MSCEQKSGVFLKKSCSRTVTETCDNCQKKVCHVHFHRFEANNLCEDCYWEKYLYTEEKKHKHEDVHEDSDTKVSTSPYSTADTEDSGSGGGFGGGFGGGGFGGGGASGTWTEGEAQGFNETDAGGGLIDNDDTFYYS